MKAVLYTSAYVPAEWIAAHGLEPVRLVPDGQTEVLSALNREGVCPFLQAFISEALAYHDAAAIVLTTTCDQMRRGFDVVTRAGRTPAFLLNTPRTLQSSATRRLYADELRRLSGFLTDLGGTAPSPERLTEVMLHYGDGWHRQAELADGSADCCANHRQGCALPLPPHPGIPVALVGPSLRKQDLGVFDIIEDCGGYVALDATEMGERSHHHPFDRRALRNDPFLELADAYLNGVVDVFTRPNDRFYDWLARRLRERDIRAIILHRYIWCDLWHVEFERLRARTGLPVLDLDMGGDSSPADSRIRSRIGAFMEMLA